MARTSISIFQFVRYARDVYGAVCSTSAMESPAPDVTRLLLVVVLLDLTTLCDACPLPRHGRLQLPGPFPSQP